MKIIETVPAIKRVQLKNVGCWGELCMEFIPGLNIITDESRGSGKSTILNAILKAVHPSGQMNYPPSATKGFSEGEISVELMSPSIALRISDSANTRQAQTEQSSFERLRSTLEAGQPGTALLVESEAVEQLDANADEVLKFLNTPPCQVICVMGQHLQPEQFSQARIYVCGWNQETNMANVRLHLNGCSKLQKNQPTSSTVTKSVL